jgi:hypothetical protein
MIGRFVLAAAVAGFAVANLTGAAAAAGAHAKPYGHADHYKPVNVYFKEEVKVYKPGYGYVVGYKTCYYSKVFDSHGHAFLKKTCVD